MRAISRSILGDACGQRRLAVEFAFVAHRLAMRASGGASHEIALMPGSVADVYALYLADCARSMSSRR